MMSPTRNSVLHSLCARKSASASALQPRVPRCVSEMKMVRWLWVGRIGKRVSRASGGEGFGCAFEPDAAAMGCFQKGSGHRRSPPFRPGTSDSRSDVGEVSDPRESFVAGARRTYESGRKQQTCLILPVIASHKCLNRSRLRQNPPRHLWNILDFQGIFAWNLLLTIARQVEFHHIAAARYRGSVCEAAALPGRFLPELGRFLTEAAFFFSARIFLPLAASRLLTC